MKREDQESIKMNGGRGYQELRLLPGMHSGSRQHSKIPLPG